MEFYTKAFFVALAALVAYGMLLVLQPFAGSMAWAIFLAFLLYPLHLWLTRKLRGRAGTSAGIITGLTPFALLTPLTLLGIRVREPGARAGGVRPGQRTSSWMAACSCASSSTR